MYSDKKTAMNIVRSIGWQTFSNLPAMVKPDVKRSASSASGDRAGFSPKYSLANMARLFARVGVFSHHVESLFNLTQPEFERHFLVFPANSQLQHIARLLFLQPAINPPWHFSTVPRQNSISSSQSRPRCHAFTVNLALNKLAILLVPHHDTNRLSPPLP